MQSTRKKILILAVFALAAVVAVLGGIKGLQIDRMIAHGKQAVPPPEAVTTATASLQSWESLITAVGSLTAALTCAAAAAWADGPGSPVARVALVVLAVVVLRHRDNLRRILRGEERSFRRSGPR